jgi:hypothetical protein
MALVLADHQHRFVTADDPALLAHRLDRRSYLHDPFRLWSRRGGSGCRDGCRYRFVVSPSGAVEAQSGTTLNATKSKGRSPVGRRELSSA